MSNEIRIQIQIISTNFTLMKDFFDRNWFSKLVLVVLDGHLVLRFCVNSQSCQWHFIITQLTDSLHDVRHIIAIFPLQRHFWLCSNDLGLDLNILFIWKIWMNTDIEFQRHCCLPNVKDQLGSKIPHKQVFIWNKHR